VKSGHSKGGWSNLRPHTPSFLTTGYSTALPAAKHIGDFRHRLVHLRQQGLSAANRAERCWLRNEIASVQIRHDKSPSACAQISGSGCAGVITQVSVPNQRSAARLVPRQIFKNLRDAQEPGPECRRIP
jgi:hypothetical protein